MHFHFCCKTGESGQVQPLIEERLRQDQLFPLRQSENALIARDAYRTVSLGSKTVSVNGPA
jgi:hypothetical protein